MTTAKVKQIYIDLGFGSYKLLFSGKSFLLYWHIIYLSSQEAADTNITNKAFLSLSFMGIICIWPD